MNTAFLPALLLDNSALILSVIHVVSATAVTLHALIKKRNVPAAIGWIGLAWLSPFFGPLLYFGFGINRVQRRARRLRGIAELPASSAQPGGGEPRPASPLATAVARMTGTEPEPGRVVAVLACGDEAYPEMLAAIDGASISIAMSSYIFRLDDVGTQFIDALARADRRGVAVRVLIDGFGGGFLFSAAYHRLQREQVPSARYLHSLLPWKMPLLNLRLHKKILVVDGATAFVGGLNIGAENVLASSPARPVRDLHCRVEGPVVRQIMDSFQEDWAFTTGEVLSGETWFAPALDRQGAPARAISSGPDQSVDLLLLLFVSAINSATSTIRIATPYFLPDEQVLTALHLAVLRGVAVHVVVPSVNDHRIVGWAMTAHIRPLLKMGCHVWASQPPFDHSKIMVIDDDWCLIGSANWDARSLRLNFELTVGFQDGALARRLGEIVSLKCQDRVTLSHLDARWRLVKVRDAAARLMLPYL